MRRRLTLIAVGAALCASPLGLAPAAAETADPNISTAFRLFDRNGDAFIDRGEFRRARAARFDRMDRDRDGKVTEAEFKAQQARALEQFSVLAGVPRREPQAGEAVAARAFHALDRNGDGVVDRDEFMAAGEARFDGTDRDKDGRISREEWAAAASARNQAAPRRP